MFFCEKVCFYTCCHPGAAPAKQKLHLQQMEAKKEQQEVPKQQEEPKQEEEPKQQERPLTKSEKQMQHAMARVRETAGQRQA